LKERPPSSLSECEVFSGGLREPSRITHQLGKGDLKAKSGFPDAAGSHPLALLKSISRKDNIFVDIECDNPSIRVHRDSDLPVVILRVRNYILLKSIFVSTLSSQEDIRALDLAAILA
jgi:hypothetical protein